MSSLIIIDVSRHSKPTVYMANYTLPVLLTLYGKGTGEGLTCDSSVGCNQGARLGTVNSDEAAGCYIVT